MQVREINREDRGAWLSLRATLWPDRDDMRHREETDSLLDQERPGQRIDTMMGMMRTGITIAPALAAGGSASEAPNGRAAGWRAVVQVFRRPSVDEFG